MTSIFYSQYAPSEAGAGVEGRSLVDLTSTSLATLFSNADNYSNTKTYTRGDLVYSQSSIWVYVNSTSTSGNAPPMLPALANSYWEYISSTSSNTYIWIAYANSVDGLIFTDFTTDSATVGGINRKWIGIASNRTNAIESTDPADYSWTKITDSMLWTNISGTGKPEDNATLGARAGVNLRNNADTVILGDSAIITNQGTAAAITGQSSWATYATYSPDALAKPNPNLIYDAGLALGGQQWGLNGWSWNSGSDIGFYVAAPASSVNMQIGKRMAIYPNSVYTFSLHSGGNGYSGTGTLQLNFYDSADNFISQSLGNGTAQNLGYTRTSVTGTSPSNAAYVRCYMAAPASLTGFFLVFKPKLELSSSMTAWTNESTYGARYQSGRLIDSLEPSEINANVTETRTAAAITGQGPLATAPSDSPYINANITINADGTIVGAGGGRVTIGGLGYTGALNATYGARVGVNLRNSADTAYLGDVDVVTNYGIASAITGQSEWATWALPTGKLAALRPNIFPWPNGVTDGRSMADIGWINTINGSGWSTLSTGSAAWTNGNYMQIYRTSGGATSVYPLYDMPWTDAGHQVSVGVNGYATGGTFYPYVEFLNSAKNTVLSSFAVTYNSLTDRWEGTGTAPSGVGYVRLVMSATHSATSTYQDLVFWSIKVERGPYATAILDTAQPKIGGNQVEWNTGETLNALRPAELGSNVTEIRTAAAISGQGSLATKNNVVWNAEIAGRPAFVTDTTVSDGLERLNPWYVRNPADGSYLGGRWAAEGGANITEIRTAAAISGQAWAATNGSQSSVDNNYVGGFANQAIDSEFTLQNTCWNEGYSSGGAWTWEYFTGLISKRFIVRSNSSAIAGQQVNLGQTTACGIPVVEGQRVECSAILASTNMDVVELYVGWFDNTGGYITATKVANGIQDTMVGGFATVPSGLNVATAKLLVAMRVASNGYANARMAQPFIRRCGANQVTLSYYNPGFLGERGANVTETRVASAIAGQGIGATANNLAQLDSIAAAQLTTAYNGGVQTAGYGETLKRKIGVGASINLYGSIACNAGGTSGSISARLQWRYFNNATWNTIATGSGSSCGPTEPGGDEVTSTWTNTTGIEQLFEFRVIDVRTPSGAGGTINYPLSYITG